ncbi:hypothetical protein Egran_00624 [Elaphomyces granulatus]|uniref:Transcription factor TFIIIC complex subunit Tfc6 n=1 Tax=Elaphomyces granulatus TaxID=519963 RepID=A0A232M5B5_9EURO|nr:hypothetical protein Egran_00624 [Elaphomyces granulatus]
MAAPRRSGRTARYADDPLKAAEISGSSSSEADVGANNWKGKRRVSQKDSSDEDFAGVVGHGEEELMVMDDDHSEDEEDEAASSNDEEMSLINSRPGYKAAKSLPSRHAGEAKKVVQVSNSGGMRNRGTPNPTEHVSKSKHLQITFGTDERDLTAVIYARDRWCRGIDAGLPTRMSLNQTETLPSHGPEKAFGVDPEEIEMEATQGWDWYYNDQIGGDFRRRQRTESIQKGEARRKYLPLQNPGKHKVIIGPVNDQKAYELGQDDILNFGDAWDTINSRIKKDKKSSQHSSTMKKVDGSASTSETQEKKVREGWILNLGNKVQCLAWAPNQDSLVQYLAVAVVISEQQKEEFRVSGELKGAPAFTPSDPYPAALQIWSFKARDGEMYTKSLDMAFEPKLRLVLCTDWGDLRRISWCPVARTPREEDEPKRLGLLAGIWGDGSVKILDVTVDGDSGATEYYKVTSAAFSCKPPSTVCTCLTWLSPSDIAVGCANGFVAIWNIASLPATEIESSPVPYFYMQLHSTYILNISSAYPQHPHLLGTTSMGGQTRLTSILDPQKDMVDTVRMRMGSMQMSYSPVLQAFFSHDENDFVRLLAIRRFYSTITVARLPSTVSTLAPCSFWHPSALLGCTGGTVIAVNPLRRLLHSREKNWHLIWFTHEWIRNQEENGVCVSRFLDGHRAESVGLMRNMVTDRRRLVNGSLIVTIHEEGTHITTLAWNPNQQCAGWASAGMGCGLVRVEDLAM